MPDYRYKAIGADGARIEGVQTAHSEIQILELLRNNKQVPISIEEISNISKDVNLSSRFNKVKLKDISIFCRQFFTMLNAGVTILNVLEILKNQTLNKRLQVVIHEIHEKVQKGMSLSEAMGEFKKDFPDLLINMVAVGEVSGNLDGIMERMAIHFDKEYRTTEKVKSAMVYPVVLAIVAISVVTFLLVAVMPTFVGMFQSSGVELPLPTRILLTLSNALIEYGLFIVIAFGGIFMFIKAVINTPKGQFAIDQMKLKLPVVKALNKMIITTRFTRTMSMLVASGVPLIQSLEVVAKVVQNKVVEKSMHHAITEVKKGISLSIPLKEMGHFPVMVHYMVGIGEESGSLDDILSRTATFYDEELETTIARTMALIEPIMIVVMAILIGSIAIAMVMPMFDMMKTV